VGSIFVFGLRLVFVELMDEERQSRESQLTRMPLESGLSVSSLDLVLGRSLFDSEHFVGLYGWRLVELEVIDIGRHD
jgi:hypothetical protein